MMMFTQKNLFLFILSSNILLNYCFATTTTTTASFGLTRAAVPAVVQIGGLFTRLYNGQPFELGQYMLSASLLALQEINDSTTILKSTQLQIAVEECYLSANAAISNTVDLITQAFSKKGVKAILGPGISKEATASASAASSFNTVQISSLATSRVLSNNVLYPFFTRTCPSDIYQARAMANLVCEYGWKNIITFSSSDDYGTNGMASFLLAFGSQCSPNYVLASLTVDANAPIVDAATLSPLIKLEARIFVFFMSASTASSVINAGFNVGLFFEGIQIIGSDAMMGPEIYQSIPPARIPIVLKGMLGFVPSVSYTTSSVAQKFLQNMLAYPNTIYPNNGCSTDKDNNGQYLYLEPADLKFPTNYTCTGLNISTLLEDGSNLTPFAAYAYDATYLLAYGLDYVINNGQSVTGPNLYNAMVNKVSFQGVTGMVKLASTGNTDPLLGPGDRIGDIAYSLTVIYIYLCIHLCPFILTYLHVLYINM